MKVLPIVLMLLSGYAQAQPALHQVELTGGVGGKSGTMSISWQRGWSLGEAGKLRLGTGARASSFFGRDIYYATAPAKLTSGSTGPLVLFKPDIVANMDSFLVDKARANFVNLMVLIDYKLSDKWSVGFNIDVIGFSFGKSVTGTYINGSAMEDAGAALTRFNILLISDNDRGSLNSELYVRRAINDNVAFKLAAQFLFTEYTTDTSVQTFPEDNARFRKKSLMVAAGIVKRLK